MSCVVCAIRRGWLRDSSINTHDSSRHAARWAFDQNIRNFTRIVVLQESSIAAGNHAKIQSNIADHYDVSSHLTRVVTPITACTVIEDGIPSEEVFVHGLVRQQSGHHLIAKHSLSEWSIKEHAQPDIRKCNIFKNSCLCVIIAMLSKSPFFYSPVSLELYHQSLSIPTLAILSPPLLLSASNKYTLKFRITLSTLPLLLRCAKKSVPCRRSSSSATPYP